jgi:hypothetical protein
MKQLRPFLVTETYTRVGTRSITVHAESAEAAIQLSRRSRVHWDVGDEKLQEETFTAYDKQKDPVHAALVVVATPKREVGG